MRIQLPIILSSIGVIALVSCDKILNIPDPIDSITTSKVFTTDVQAEAAMTGVYSSMINVKTGSGDAAAQFSAGLCTIAGSFSADDMNTYSQSNGWFDFNANRLRYNNALHAALWQTAYETIYGVNAILEGIAASTSSKLTANTRTRLTGEAKFIRAFSYFYLVNFYGDVPLALTVDVSKTRGLPRAPKAAIYKQMIEDLLDAQTKLPPENTNSSGEHIYPDKWAATALLARVYLFNGDFPNAFKQADAVIGNATQYHLEDDPGKVFLKESREAIWQLKQTVEGSMITGNATPEGFYLIPTDGQQGQPFHILSYYLSPQLLGAFETNDERRTAWVGTSVNANNSGNTYYFPYKYKTGRHNYQIGGVPTEYYVALRLAEQYLIRAEAAANGAGNLPDAIADVDIIRNRSGLDDLPDDLTQPQVLAAVAKERQVEFFVEWGHRWLDLKRTGQAAALLSVLPQKQPWQGNYQLLYPIPEQEMILGPKLTPNPGY